MVYALAVVMTGILGGLAGFALGSTFGWLGIILAALVGTTTGIGCASLASWISD